MPSRYITGAVLVAVVAAAASAQETSEYYVVQDATSQTCSVVDRKPEPTERNVVQIGSVVFKSRAEAEAGMQTIKACAGN